MTPQEQQYLQAVAAQRQRQLQTDPFARAVNDYGQGSDFLQLDAQPESWDRLGEINDVYSDLFKTTGTYLQDFVPGLYPEAEDPGLYTGYRSDRAELYRNNPAYAQLEQFMAEGAPFDEAVQLVTKLAATNPQIAAGLPQYQNQPDQQAFRTSAESYISERAREGREFDEYDARRQQYEDYVNPQTGWGLEADKTEDITPYLRQMAQAPRQPRTAAAGGGSGGRSGVGSGGLDVAGTVDRWGNAIEGIFDPNKPNPDFDMPSINEIGRSIEGVFDPNKRQPRETTGRIGDLGPGRRTGSTPAAAGPGATERILAATRGRAAQEVADKNKLNQTYNKALQDAYEQLKGKKEGRLAPSKKQQNQAKLVQAYNMLMYGE